MPTLLSLRSLAALFGCTYFFFHCVGPDLGSLQNKNKKTIPADDMANCAFCQQVPRITTPAHQAILDNTLAEITLAPINAEACEYAFSGGTTFTALRKKSAHTITQFTPTTPWPVGQVIAVSVRCFDSEDTATARVTASASSEFSVVLPTPTLINPFSDYITTSKLLRLMSSSHSIASAYEWQIRQSGSVVATATASSAETVTEIPFPPANYGIFEARTRYRDVNDVYSEYSSWVEFTIKDRSTGSLVYAQDFTMLSLCGDKMVMLWAGCSGVHILGTYPSCDSTGWFGGGGNVWICNTGFEGTNVLQTNNSAMNSLSFYSGFYNSIDATHVSYEVETFQHGTAEDAAATVVACRAYPAEGNDGFTFVVYPYRTSGVNVEIRERRFSTNTYNVLASAYRSEAYLATGPARTWLRFDCLGSSFTGYYKNSSGKWFPLLVAQSSFAASSPHRIGMGTGQGNQIIKLRIYNIDVREFSL